MNDNSILVDEVSRCRLCSAANLTHLLSLGNTPLANDFRPISAEKEHYYVFPLDLIRCDSCAHVQLRHVVSPELLFRNYTYVSGTSKTFVKHFEEYFSWIKERIGLSPNSLIIEIGSNDGTLLNFFSQDGFRSIGVDPAANIVADLGDRGFETICDFFNQKSADQIVGNHGLASLIVANNVFAHIKDMSETIESARNSLCENGFIVFEVSYLLDVLEKNLFDTIYHEHLDYHSVTSLIPFLRNHGFKIVEVLHVQTHGGSIRVLAQLTSGSHPIDESVELFERKEREFGLHTNLVFQNFARRLAVLAEKNKQFLAELRDNGSTVVGFGAPAKMTTLVHYFGLTENTFDYIVDDSHLKQNTFAPGGYAKVLPSIEIYKSRPDYLYVLAWNFSDSIVQNHPEWTNRFIIPVPRLTLR
jgi:hypothetical protein